MMYCIHAQVVCPHAGGSFCCQTGDDREAPRDLPNDDADAPPEIREPDEAA